jgi:hypothetical protein
MMGKVMSAAGRPNEYNTATFVQYGDTLIKPNNRFNSFFQDPEIQTILHVRGRNIPGVNFVVEKTTEGNSATSGALDEEDVIYPTNGWQVCNDKIVSLVCVELCYFAHFVVYIFLHQYCSRYFITYSRIDAAERPDDQRPPYFGSTYAAVPGGRKLAGAALQRRVRLDVQHVGNAAHVGSELLEKKVCFCFVFKI